MNNYYDKFLKALSERYPSRPELVAALQDTLSISKENIYRRLRRDVIFTPEEMMRIADAWNMSLDNVISTCGGRTSSLRFSLIDYINPDEHDYSLFGQYNGMLELVAQDPDGEFTEMSNTLPGSLYNKSDNLLRFFTMKWFYKYGGSENVTPMSEIRIPERMRDLEREYVDLLRQIPKKNAIQDRHFVEHLVDEINYFHSVRMVTADELAALKGELLEIMDYTEDVALKGYFPETGNKCFLYLSHMRLETEYSLFGSKNMTLSVVKILERNGIVSLDKQVFDKFSNMARANISSSVLMSMSNRLELIRFYDKQKRTIEAMK